jgi:S1-C subfamily serine protease
VIVQVGETPTRNVSELLTAVAALKPGTATKFDVRRGDSKVVLDVTPGTRPTASTLQQQGRRP